MLSNISVEARLRRWDVRSHGNPPIFSSGQK